MEIAGNVVLVSGGASGLGAATARMIVASGGSVVIADLQVEAGERLAAELGARARFQRCDVTSEADCVAAVGSATALGPLRGLVGCAGIVTGARTVGKSGPHALDTFARVVAINLVGTFNLLRLAAAAMATLDPLAGGERGVLVNTSSTAAFEGQVGQAAYAASKGGVAAMTLPVARDLAGVGIRCMTIAPGLFETPMMAGMTPQVRASLGAQVPFPARLGEPDEFARLVHAIFVNPLLNGSVIRLDGALRMAPK